MSLISRTHLHLVVRLLATALIAVVTCVDGSISMASASGRLLAAPINTVLNGTGAPAASLGANGDFYIDKKSFNMYGPKANGHWPLPVSLRGPVGLMGPVGLSGKVVTASGGVIAGERGVTGAKGETGTAGLPGSIGLPGPIGLTGAPGSAGPAGSPGSSGAGSPGATGAVGATGATGAVGPVGLVGPIGPTGSIGATGASGSSSISSGAITFANQIVLPHSSQDSNAFGEFIAGRSYVVDVIINGVAADGGSLSLNVNFVAGSGIRIVSSAYTIGTGFSFRGGTAKFESNAIAKLLVTVDSGTGQQITVTASSSDASGADPMSLSGYFTNQQVGSVS